MINPIKALQLGHLLIKIYRGMSEGDKRLLQRICNVDPERGPRACKLLEGCVS